MKTTGFLAAAILIVAANRQGIAFGDWPQFAGGAGHAAVATDAPDDLTAILWVAGESPPGTPIVFEGPSSPVVFEDRVFVNAKHFTDAVYTHNKLIAFEAGSGQVLWETIVDKTVFDFWFSPVVDAANGAVLLGTGGSLHSLDAVGGGINWSTPLDQGIVNATAVVAQDLTPGRAFMTDYDPFGSAGSLYCINTSDFESAANPYQPGDVVWRETLGDTSGNTPAYHDGTVYVAAVAGPVGMNGCVYAFDVDAPEPTRLFWMYELPVAQGFFGVVGYAAGFVYAASYNFDGSGDNSFLVKLDALTGDAAWIVPCERTLSAPVVDGDRIYLAAGIPGFGSVPKVQAFRDDGSSAVKIWDTWNDTAGDLLVGGWTHQPVLADGILFAGAIPTAGSFFAPYTDLYLLDVSKTPDDAGFIVEHLPDMGSSPAICGGRLYTIGQAGLHAVAARGDFCGADGTVNGLDVQCFTAALLSGSPSEAEIALGDFDDDAMLSLDDVPGFLTRLLGP